VAWLDDLQAEWVRATRISPPLVTELLDWTGPQVVDTLRRQDPQARTAQVSWAGTSPQPAGRRAVAPHNRRRQRDHRRPPAHPGDHRLAQMGLIDTVPAACAVRTSDVCGACQRVRACSGS
jgi:hypothetical protein